MSSLSICRLIAGFRKRACGANPTLRSVLFFLAFKAARRRAIVACFFLILRNGLNAWSAGTAPLSVVLHAIIERRRLLRDLRM